MNQWKNMGVGALTPYTVKNPCITLDFLKTSVVPQYPLVIGSRTPMDTKSADTEVPHIKWCRTMHTVSLHTHRFPKAD